MASAGNVLILINGIPVNDPSVNDNYFDLNFISTDQVERVEVLKGGQSTLYGSDAVTGVINIITRKSGPAGKHFDIAAAAGSYGTYKANVGFRQTICFIAAGIVIWRNIVEWIFICARFNR